MVFSTDLAQLKEWMPLVMEGRDESESSCNFMAVGTDVNFGELTRSMFNHLNELEGVSIHFNHEVRTLKQRKDKTWRKKLLIWLQAKKEKFTLSLYL
jgi:malate dehydrogenase (quinone)